MKVTTLLVLAWFSYLSQAIPASVLVGSPEVTAIATRTIQERHDTNIPIWASGTWTSVPCTIPEVTDAATPADKTWKAVGAEDAWSQLMAAWNAPRLPDAVYTNFGAFAFNQFYDRALTNCADISDTACGTTTLCAKAGYPAAGYQLLNSLVGLHNLISEANEALDRANEAVKPSMELFSANFAKFPADNSKTIKLVIDGIFGAVSFGLAGLWNVLIKNTTLAANAALKGSLQDSSYAVVGLLAASLKDGAIPPPADVYQEVTVFSEFTGNYTLQLKELFELFLYRALSADNSTTQKQLTDLVHGGAIISILQVANGTRFTDLSMAMSSVLFGKLIPAAWAVSSNNQRPFLLRVNASDYKCGSHIKPLDTDAYHKAIALGKFELGLWITNDVAMKTSWCDPDGNTWFLLNAHYSQLQQNCETGQGGHAACDGTEKPFQALDGGNSTSLNGRTWGNVTIENIVRSSYGGFIANGHKNGYVMPSDSSLLVYNNLTGTDTGIFPLIGGITTPGFFNFPICLDARVAAKNIKGDPSQKNMPCDTYGGDSNPQNAGYKPGFCGVHVTQYQKHEPNEINPLPDYQMAITVKDSNNNQIGYATKQDARHALIVDSRLPLGLIVQDGLVDDDPVCFWYSNQWWCSNDQAHHCNFGKFDNGKREGDCGFTCPLPTDTNNGPAAQPTPADAVVAESLTVSGPATTISSSAAKPTYATGWCGVHVRQYQKHEGANSDNPTGDFELEITVFDAKQNAIGSSGKVDAPAGKHITVSGGLLLTFYIVTKQVDYDALMFSYGMQAWDSDKGCKVGDYDNGHRDMDCGFNC